MNLPNAITVGRIAATPLIALLPFVPSWPWRLVAFVLFIVAAVTDYYDGALARSRGQITDLGKQLDPLADKLLLVGTFVPMFLLTGSGGDPSLVSPWQQPLVPGVLGPMLRDDGGAAFPVHVPFEGTIGLPWWVLAIVIGRELFMTAFRSAAARRGTVIAAIGPAKWKTGFQSTWVGATYFWFFAATLAADQRWTGSAWRAFAGFNGLVVAVTMVAAVALTVYSLVLYLQRYGHVFTRPSTPRA
jgi:CDP-diacylglycerol---glycerol-3-phosphate 3-phosphatidyltransferase